MKIKILDWSIFESENKIYFTRDINITNEINIVGLVHDKKKLNYVAVMDFYRYKFIVFIKHTKNIEIIESSIPSNCHFCSYHEYQYLSEDGIVRSKYTNIIAPKWMIDDPSFFSMMEYSYVEAYRYYTWKCSLLDI